MLEMTSMSRNDEWEWMNIMRLFVLGPRHGEVSPDSSIKDGYWPVVMTTDLPRTVDRVTYYGKPIAVRAPRDTSLEAIILGLLSIPGVEIVWHHDRRET